MPKLFVIFHGSWSFLQTPNDLVMVKTPDMGEDHVYRAGNWLAETSLRRGSLYRLDNVTGATGAGNLGRVDPSVNLVIKPARLESTTHRGAYTTWVFKRPLAIYSLGQLTIRYLGEPPTLGSDKSIVNQTNPASVLTPPFRQDLTTSLIQVFEYDYMDGDADPTPTIKGLPWKPRDIAGVATLHLFAEHEVPEPVGEPSHLAEAYHFGALLLGADFHLDISQEAPPNPQRICKRSAQVPVPTSLVPRCFELEPLQTRNVRLANAGVGRATIGPNTPKGTLMNDEWPIPGSTCLDEILRPFECTPSGPSGDTPTCLPNWGEGECN